MGERTTRFARRNEQGAWQPVVDSRRVCRHYAVVVRRSRRDARRLSLVCRPARPRADGLRNRRARRGCPGSADCRAVCPGPLLGRNRRREPACARGARRLAACKIRTFPPERFLPRYIGLFLLLSCLTGVSPAFGQARPPRAGVGTIEGAVTTQKGSIALGGAQITVHNAAKQEVASGLTEGDGRFRLTAIQEGTYTVTASLDGFATAFAPVVVTADQAGTVALDLPLATVTQTIEVVAPMAIVSSTDTLSRAETITSRETEQMTGGTSLSGALRLVAS